MKNVNIVFMGKNYKYPSDTTLEAVAVDFKKYYKNDILIGEINGKPCELSTSITYDCKVNFFDYNSSIGNVVYQNGLIFLLIYVFKHYYNMDVTIRHSIDKGIYITTEKKITESFLEETYEKMKDVVNLELPIEKKFIKRTEAIKYYKKEKCYDKVEILKYTTNTNISLYKLGEVYDYFFSFLPTNTKRLSKFKLTFIDKNGFVLSYPSIYNDCKIAKYIHHEKIFSEFRSYSSWSETIGIKHVSDLNKKISEGDFSDIILMSENYQNNNLYNIAKKIVQNKNIKMILISGPSSSGKTTSSRKLKLFLKSLGLNPISISIDDYYLDRKDTPKKEDGSYDFESINALDLELFNKQIKDLLKGKNVTIPKYNFMIGKKEFKESPIKLNENEILIIEGLHALNNKLTSGIENSLKFKIYLAPLTVLNLDSHNRIKTTDNRLLRRIVRDNRTRGYSASKTLEAWKSVREGEEENVFKFQDEADVIFNTSLIYEINALKTYVEPVLYSVKEEDENYSEAIRLLNLLKNVLPIPSEMIPSDSIVREFIGNSYFKGE